MTVLCAWAAWDENKKARGGKKGDQTGGEVHKGPWWDFGQNCIIRPKNDALADKLADVMETLADNDLIGYDQGERTSLYNELKRIGFDYKNLRTACECDCSALVAAAVNCCGIKVSPNAWTGNLSAVLVETGLFTRIVGSKYTEGDSWLKRGDIVLNEQSHVIVALENGANELAKVSGFSVKGGKYPKKITRGDRFTIAGTIKSTLPLASVEAGVQTKAGKWVEVAHTKRKAAGTSYNLAALDEAIAFRKLPAGSYYFRVFAKDESGTRKRLVNRTFEVVAKKAKKTLEAVALEIYTGRCYLDEYKTWGAGAVRKARLQKAGYTNSEIKEIQKLVNGLF